MDKVADPQLDCHKNEDLTYGKDAGKHENQLQSRGHAS